MLRLSTTYVRMELNTELQGNVLQSRYIMYVTIPKNREQQLKEINLKFRMLLLDRKAEETISPRHIHLLKNLQNPRK